MRCNVNEVFEHVFNLALNLENRIWFLTREGNGIMVEVKWVHLFPMQINWFSFVSLSCCSHTMWWSGWVLPCSKSQIKTFLARETNVIIWHYWQIFTCFKMNTILGLNVRLIKMNILQCRLSNWTCTMAYNSFSAECDFWNNPLQLLSICFKNVHIY